MHGVPGNFQLLLHFILALCCCGMVTVGLPTGRQERGSPNDVVYGDDFVAILLDSPAQEDLINIKTSTEPEQESSTRIPVNIRQTRSTLYSRYYPYTSSPHAVDTTTGLNTDNIKYSSSTPEGDKVVVLAMSVSSSADSSKSQPDRSNVKPIDEESSGKKAVMQSEFRPSIVAQSSKTDFSVEESEPITQDKVQLSDTDGEYPARVQSVPSPQALPLISSNSNLYQDLDQEGEKDNLSPFHHQTLIFHDNPHNPEKAKSVSYTSVIHTLPQDTSKQWESQNENKENLEHDRQERHYDANANYGNNYYVEANNKNVQLPSKENHNDDESFTFSNSPIKTPQNDWNNPPHQQHIDTSTGRSESTTSIDNKNPHNNHQQRIYAEPEKNYEIEESVSVLSNGRVHGVQPVQIKPSPSLPDVTTSKNTSGKQGDNQKVGYVVEGRNYRKYRVEERTPDGFIVGEYGVVSHNDGSLRGVRYTADGTINPRLIYDALMKFLSL